MLLSNRTLLELYRNISSIITLLRDKHNTDLVSIQAAEGQLDKLNCSHGFTWALVVPNLNSVYCVCTMHAVPQHDDGEKGNPLFTY